MRWALLIYIFYEMFQLGNCGATMEQLKKTGEMVRQVCQPKTKVTDGLIDQVKAGNFPDDKTIKCYTHCILEMSNMMKKNKINFEAAAKQIELLMPEELIAPYLKSMDACKDAGKGVKDACDLAYAMMKCIYDNNPHFLFP